jgi:hypothetical protein
MMLVEPQTSLLIEHHPKHLEHQSSLSVEQPPTIHSVRTIVEVPEVKFIKLETDHNPFSVTTDSDLVSPQKIRVSEKKVFHL